MTAGIAGEADASTRPPSFDGAPCVVFDTNVLVSLYVFADSRYAPLREALEQGRVRAVTDDACLSEFSRVLAYPQFGVTPERQAQALADYGRHASRGPAAKSDLPLPRCKDRDDQKFLELARDAGAAWLITGDKALLTLARRQRLAHLFRIVTPDAALLLLRESSSADTCVRAARSVASASA